MECVLFIIAAVASWSLHWPLWASILLTALAVLTLAVEAGASD
jgi:hypothetical protein